MSKQKTTRRDFLKTTGYAAAAVMAGCASGPMIRSSQRHPNIIFILTDVGTHDEASMDYPDTGKTVAEKISSGEYERGILICGTGLGMSMVANKYPHVRAALCNDLFSAAMSRRHNNANILVMGGRVIGDILALEILKTWLNTPFEAGRHQRRLDMFDSI